MAKGADGKVVIDTELDKSGFDKGVKTLEKVVSKLKSAVAGLQASLRKGFSKLESAVAGLWSSLGEIFAVGAIISFGKQCIELGSDVAEVQNVVDVSFGEMAYKMEAFAETSVRSFGLSKLAAKKTGSTYMAMAKGMGIASDTASDMALNLTGMTADVASFFNISQELADIKLRSVFTGETETLKDLGIVMTQANLKQYAMEHGIYKNIAAMTQSEQVMLRYSFVMDSLALAQGDFARTQDSWANQTRILSEQWREFMSILGSGITKILLPLVQILNVLISNIISVANAVSSVLSKIFGGEAQQIQQTQAAASGVSDAIGGSVDNQNALTDAVKGTNKEMNKSLAGFDEINKLSSGASGGSGGGGAGGIGGAAFDVGDSSMFEVDPMATEEMERIKTLVDEIAKGVWLVAAGFALWAISSHLPTFLGAIARNVGLLAIAVGGFVILWESFSDAMENGVDWGNIIGMIGGTTIAALALSAVFGPMAAGIALVVGGVLMLIAGFKDISKNGFTLKNTLLTIAGIVATGLGLSLLTHSLIPLVIAGILGILLAIVNLAGNGDQLIQNLKDVFGGFADFITGIFTGDMEKAFGGLKRMVKGVINTILTIVGSMVNLIIKGINWLLNKINSIKINVPDWLSSIVGFKSWSPSIPNIKEWQIPQLAQGAVIPPNRRFLAELGDQRSGTNIEAPLETIVQAMRIALGDSGNREAVMVVDGEVFGRLAYKLGGRESRRVGVRFGGVK